ncbi:MAG: endonuclease domain-containing protein [Sphingomonadaceae bacterium]
MRKFDKVPDVAPDVLRQPIKAVKRARQLRKEMSLPEVLLWVQLQRRPGGHGFRKQVPQVPYTLDFACLKAMLAIEVDGEAHNRGDQPRKDEVRDRIMAARGFRTLRLPAYEVLKNMEGCVMAIVAACDEANPPRTGEVARSDGGVPRSRQDGAVEIWDPSTASGPPPRSGEDLA